MKRRTRILLLIAGLLLLLVATPLLWVLLFGATLRISASEIQTVLATAFPVEETSLLVNKVVLSDPRVRIDAGSDRIAVTCTAEYRLFNAAPIQGKACISGRVVYEAAEGEFFFRSARVEELVLAGASPRAMSVAGDLVGVIARSILEGRSVYRFDMNDPAQRLARSALSDVRVRNGYLEVVLNKDDH